jgi:hypothetical protein
VCEGQDDLLGTEQHFSYYLDLTMTWQQQLPLFVAERKKGSKN